MNLGNQSTAITRIQTCAWNEMMNRKQDLWYKSAVFYELNVRAFRDSNADGKGDLNGVTEKLSYLKDFGVDCIWLLPIFPSPLRDDGYDISDYYGIHPDFGTLDDFIQLLEKAHQLGMKVITDLVLNHTSDQHPWFQAARQGENSPYHDYYVWSDSPEKYANARIIFLDTETSNWSWDPVARKYYWHRFYATQPDLNYDNLAVQAEMIKIMRFWLELGVDGFRADAVPYLFEREGTNCENLPETHEYLKQIRSFFDQYYPDRILLCEANQWPADVRPYFGDGDEFHMGFHFPVMPRIFMSVQSGNSRQLEWILKQTPEIPSDCQWCIFLRNHDELTLEMVTPEEREWMWNEYAPDKRMRLNLGIRRRLAPLLGNDQRKIGLVNSLLFTLPGSPIIYYGDEIGMGDNIELPDRNGVRTPFQWNSDLSAGFSDANPQRFYAPVINTAPFDPKSVNVEDQEQDADSLLNRVRNLIHIRKRYKVFGWGDFTWLDQQNESLAVYQRIYQDEYALFIHNLSADRITIDVFLPGVEKEYKFKELITGQLYPTSHFKSLTIELDPYDYKWLLSNQNLW
jgi:maltose alpha-D-glucosyltransferase / alpha-amylase